MSAPTTERPATERPATPTTPSPTPPSGAMLLGRIGGWCFDHGGRAVGAWLAGLVLVFVAAGVAGTAFTSTSDLPGSDSAAGSAALEEHFPELGAGGQSGTIVFRADQGVDDPEVVAAMEDLFEVVAAGFPDAAGVPRQLGATVVSPYSSTGAGQIAEAGPLAGRLAFAQVNLAADVDTVESGRIGELIAEHAPEVAGLEVFAGGQHLATLEPPAAELIGLAFAVVVLVLAFGSVLAMGLPIAVALGGVGAGIATMALLSHVITMPEDTTILGMMVGLGVGIDYALFIVTRYRELAGAGHDPRTATVLAMDTAGRAVVFAGATVVISMLGLLLVGLGWLGGMGIGVSATVLATMLTSTTLLPALLGLTHERLEITRWRGLVAAGFGALALLGAGIGSGQLAVTGLVLVLATLAAGRFVARSAGSSPAVRPDRSSRPWPTGGAEPSSAGPGPGSAPRPPCSPCWRRPPSGCDSPGPTRATSRRAPRRTRPMRCSPTGSARGSTGRSSSPRRPGRTRRPPAWRRCGRRWPRRRAWLRSARRLRARPHRGTPSS
jgi:putative drug exporter of the RND superfamily